MKSPLFLFLYFLLLLCKFIFESLLDSWLIILLFLNIFNEELLEKFLKGISGFWESINDFTILLLLKSLSKFEYTLPLFLLLFFGETGKLNILFFILFSFLSLFDSFFIKFLINKLFLRLLLIKLLCFCWVIFAISFLLLAFRFWLYTLVVELCLLCFGVYISAL